MIEIQVRLFGAFRKYEKNQALISLKIPELSSIEGVKNSIASHFKERFKDFSDEALIKDSAIADERRVLEANTLIERSCTLAILPPVCGG